MSARDVIANQLLWLDVKDDRAIANSLMRALTASGYRILGPDELDAVTVEKCAGVVDTKARKVRDKINLTAMVVSAILSETATAIRALCATHQGEVQE